MKSFIGSIEPTRVRIEVPATRRMMTIPFADFAEAFKPLVLLQLGMNKLPIGTIVQWSFAREADDFGGADQVSGIKAEIIFPYGAETVEKVRGRKFRLIGGSAVLGVPSHGTVFEYLGDDCGAAADDTRRSGNEYITVSKMPGCTPFKTVAVSMLEEIQEEQTP